MYENKYNMTLQQNIFVAKRNIVDYIWKSANLEGIVITYPETQQIYDGGNIAHLRVDEIVAINNLKHAWQFVLNSIDTEMDYTYICSINALVGNGLVNDAGNLRAYDVRMGGTEWQPQLPNKEDIENLLKEVQEIKNVTEKAIVLMCRLMKMQPFNDGNKRTSMLAANHELIKGGAGIITISQNDKAIFGRELINYYETDNMQGLKDFIYNNCIDRNGVLKEEQA